MNTQSPSTVMNEVFASGQNSFYRGLSKEANPWKGVNARAAADWDAGWLNGKAESQKPDPA